MDSFKDIKHSLKLGDEFYAFPKELLNRHDLAASYTVIIDNKNVLQLQNKKTLEVVTFKKMEEINPDIMIL